MSNTINFKAIIQYLAAIAKRELANCKGCEGSGSSLYLDTDKCPVKIVEDNPEICLHCVFKCPPCPICADLRRVAEMEWHEITSEGPDICSCGAKAGLLDSDSFDRLHLSKVNPTLTIPALRSYMEIVGVWKKFERWLFWPAYERPTPREMRSLIRKCIGPTAFYAEAARFLKGEVE